MPSPGTSVLKNATVRQLEQAVAHNHRVLFCLNALSQGGMVQESGGLTWTCSGEGYTAMVAFPFLNEGFEQGAGSGLGEFSEQDAGTRLDAMMAYYRAYPPKEIGCWSLDPPVPVDLGIMLLSRGFQPGWKPCWMGLDLKTIETLKTGHPMPAGLRVYADNDTDLGLIEGLPYGGDDGAVSRALMLAHPEKISRFIAILEGKIVGHSCVHFSTGEYGTAGIYNVGVIPSARNQGIGKAVVQAACLFAKEKGYDYAVLNATGRRMYEQIGFFRIGDGLTWWLHGQKFITDPPSKELIALAEAIGKGDLVRLEKYARQGTISPDNTDTQPNPTTVPHMDLNTPITNGMTLMQLAVHCRQPVAAEWLVENGAVLYPLDAWDLNWKDRAEAILKAAPKEVDRKYGDRQTTLLHLAAERDDPALAKLAISARPDLHLKDKMYHSTALDWAIHLKKKEIIRLIKAYRSSLSS